MKIARLAVIALACLLTISAGAAAQTVLNVNVWIPPSHPLVSNVTLPFCADIEKSTEGRVRCNVLPKAVAAPAQTLDAVRDGLADLSFAIHGYTPGRFVLTDIAEFPFLGDTAEQVSVAYQRIHARILARFEEHKGVHVLGVFTHGPGQIYNTKRAVNSLKDLEGLKIRIGGGVVNDVAKALGTVPMLKPAPESYELLSQGVADGVFLPKESISSFKLGPLVKHATFVPGGLYNVSFVMLMNQSKWNAISDADRTAIERLSGEALAARAGKAWDFADASGEKAIRESNIAVVTASADFVAEIRSKTAGIEQTWFDKVRTKGLDGAATLAAFRAEIASIGK